MVEAVIVATASTPIGKAYRVMLIKCVGQFLIYGHIEWLE